MILQLASNTTLTEKYFKIIYQVYTDEWYDYQYFSVQSSFSGAM